ncbi:hypothetical protein RRG08_038399 [Elysia crispata]|uniref:Uncharacterized protein n=1 Tax=Elysia crispata TaxID=231223 RepID=A0AAE1A7Y3_9GAST|nr:hypothetical protein RRG08_038399 [Elysia crispata]
MEFSVTQRPYGRAGQTSLILVSSNQAARSIHGVFCNTETLRQSGAERGKPLSFWSHQTRPLSLYMEFSVTQRPYGRAGQTSLILVSSNQAARSIHGVFCNTETLRQSGAAGQTSLILVSSNQAARSIHGVFCNTETLRQSGANLSLILVSSKHGEKSIHRSFL